MGGLDFTIYTKEDLKEAVQALGFLPLFANEIQDFSIEEHTVPKAWFSEEPGVWEWKGPVIRDAQNKIIEFCLLTGKAGAPMENSLEKSRFYQRTVVFGLCKFP